MAEKPPNRKGRGREGGRERERETETEREREREVRKDKMKKQGPDEIPVFKGSLAQITQTSLLTFLPHVGT